MLVSLIDLYSPAMLSTIGVHKFYIGYPESVIKGGGPQPVKRRIWALLFLVFSITIMVFGVRCLKALRLVPPKYFKTTLTLNIVILLYSLFLFYCIYLKHFHHFDWSKKPPSQKGMQKTQQTHSQTQTQQVIRSVKTPNHTVQTSVKPKRVVYVG